jgi:putative component of membrane protein insertase Oxa1/YidC/SpoIIIJ protein YidD
MAARSLEQGDLPGFKKEDDGERRTAMKAMGVLWLAMALFLFSCVTSVDKNGVSILSFQPMEALIDFYQGPLHHCSAARYGECPMYPSCSEYAKQAFQKYGVFMGAVIATDRVMRCGRDELKSAPLILVDGKMKYYDPLEQNTFWWDGR